MRTTPHWLAYSQAKTDRFSIRRIMLVGLDVRLDELRRDQLDVVPLRLQLARPVMGAAARFHADQARRQVRKKWGHLIPLELLAEDDLALRIHTVNLEHALCQINANCRNLHGDASLGLSGCLTLPLWHIRCRYGWGRPSHCSSCCKS